MICPKCGFEQRDGATDCARCGVVFARYRATPAAVPMPSLSPISPPIAPAAPIETLYGGPLPAEPPPPPPGLSSLYTFEIVAILGEAFRIYFANFLAFVLLTGLTFTPVLLLDVTLTSALAVRGTTLQAVLLAIGLSLLLRLLCAPMAIAAVTFGVFQQMRGRDTSILECLRIGLTSLVPVLGVALVQGFATVLGVIFCIIPGLVVETMCAVAVPVAVEEQGGVFASLGRSSELTAGYHWPVFGVLLLLHLLGFALDWALGGLIQASLSATPALATLVREGIGVIVGGLSATTAAVMYYRLRSVQESIDVESMASVFD
ncbi:MAG: hypothetical protein QOJ16_1723 [Acidobacteriota bacterium]|nr:hypothetical protein [Acidobacteriota bacterium]